MSLKKEQVEKFINEEWKKSVVPTLSSYIKIPNQSPEFDDKWNTNGLQEKVVKLFTDWVQTQKIKGLSMEVIKEKSRTPLILIEIEPTSGKKDAPVCFLYGHMDKQPPMVGWDKGKDPYKPVLENGKLYGRGGADDGYALFSSITAIKAVQLQNKSHGKLIVLIEGSEESGSTDLPYYIEKLKTRIGTPSLIVCLDSGAGNYEQLWLTTSLRGIVNGNLEVKMLKEGVHSGSGSGIIPDTFRIARSLISRLEDPKTGKIKPKELYVEIPKVVKDQTKISAKILGDIIYKEFTFLENCQPVSKDLVELLLNRSWRPQLAVVGASGLPECKNAGNVLRSYTTLKLSMRIPPVLDSKKALKFIKDLLEKDPPYNAKVELKESFPAGGWAAPPLASWLKNSINNASKTYYGKECGYIGEGGSIPFMGMLGKKFPKAQFCIIGVLGPNSNAHGPNEFLHIDYAKRLTCCVSQILLDHSKSTDK